MSIPEIGLTLTRIEPLHVPFSSPSWIVFSPSTYRIFISGDGALCIMDARNLHRSLEERGDFSSLRFSSDGNLFAAALNNSFRVWKYSSDRYILLGEFPLPHIQYISPGELYLEFSSTSTSILSLCRGILRVRPLYSSSTTPKACRQHAAISYSGRYIATADQSQSTVTIINLRSHTPCQLVDAGGEIEGLVITSNVLLVAISEKVVGWLLTEEGRVSNVAENKMADQGDSIWATTSPFRRPRLLRFRVGGQVGVIGTDDVFPFIYHAETGGVLDRVHEPEHFGSPWVSFYQPPDCQQHRYLQHHSPPPEDGWLVPCTTTGKAGWVIDPEGRHRFWLPVEWRAPQDRKDWHHDISTLFVRIGEHLVIIKF